MKTSIRMVTAVATAWAVLGLSLLPAMAQQVAPPETPPALPAPPEQPAAPEAVPAQPAPAVEPLSTPPTSPQRVGIVKAQNVNVRGKASLQSEVIVQLHQGDRVTILGDVSVKDPKKGEPEKWLKIALPPGSVAWVSGAYVDPATGIVKADLLNVRGGPSEKHSVLGRIRQGTVVGILETQGEWVRIEPPLDAAAYVASFLVSTDPGDAPVHIAIIETDPPVFPADANVPPPIDPAPGQPIPVESLDPADPDADAEVPEVVDLVLVEETMVDEEPYLPEPPPKRIVRREGIVLRSLSIQAPTPFVLQNLDSRRIINYLNAPSTNIVLLDFFSKRVVITGEELLDERWMNTPVLNIDSIEPVPVPIREPGR